MGLLKETGSLHVAKGKKVVEVDLKSDGLSEEELLKLVLGPTGNLRAPTLRLGKKLVVGFNQEMYESLF
jgi:arsenate reductase-like glutaredoxin family protein